MKQSRNLVTKPMWQIQLTDHDLEVLHTYWYDDCQITDETLSAFDYILGQIFEPHA